MKKALAALATIGLLSGAASAQHLMGSYDWEDGGTVLGVFEDGAVVLTENSTEQAHGGTRSLKFTEEVLGGTPQAYIAYIENLTDGDTITAGAWVYDTTPNTNPSGRIWAHYADPGDVYSFRGSAGGNSTYSDGNGWSYLEWTWTFNADCGNPNGCREALVIEIRLYSGLDGDFVYVDDVSVDVQSSTGIATLTFPGGSGGGYDLTVGTLTHGQAGQFSISGATANQMQYLVYSLNGLGSTNVPQLGITLDLARPVLASQKRADANGDASWSLPIPGNSAGRRVWFQGCEQGHTTDVEDRVIQ